LTVLTTSALPEPALASQAVFRAVMDALARPGAVVPCRPGVVAPAPLSATAAALATALLDYETPFWLDELLARTPDVRDWIRFHTGARITCDPQQASFAFIADPADAPPFECFSVGTDTYPDRSATLVMQVSGFRLGAGLCLHGPGIAGDVSFSA
jgi:alpha-D-ribose 1-methylphosphonate 5-triphosphate synthase subunit PhnH